MNPSQMNAMQLKEFVQLGQASYSFFRAADFVKNGASSDLTNEDLQAAANGPFSLGEAKQITDRYSVLDQHTDPGLNGFSATVFQDKDNPNRVVLSFRGTEFNGDKIKDLLLSDLRIGFDGYASPQAVPLYLYIKQLMSAEPGVSAGPALTPEVRAGNPTALFDAPGPAQTKPSDATTEPQSVAESIAAARERFEQGLQNLKYSVDEQGGLSRSEFAERRALPLLWNLQDALLDLQLARNPDGRFTADISIDSRASRELGLGISVLSGTNGITGRFDQIARPQEIAQFDLASLQ